MDRLPAYIIFILIGVSVSAQSLNDYLSEGADQNPKLKSAYAEFEAALQRAAQESALPNPQLSFGYFVSPVETRVGAQRAKISLSQMFPWFGTRSAQKNTAKIMADVKYEEFIAATSDFYLDVKNAYFPLYQAEKKIEIQERQLDILEQQKRLATSSFSNGKASLADVLRVDIAIEDVRVNITILEDELEAKRISFNYLLNRPAQAEVVIEEQLPLLEFEFEANDSLFEKHPNYTTLLRKAEVLNAQRQVVAKGSLPHIGVGLDYAFVSKRQDVNIPDNGKDIIMPMVSMSLPIFRKQFKYAYRELKLKEEAIDQKLIEVKNSLQAQYTEAQHQYLKAYETIQLCDRQIDRLERIIDLLTKAYSNSGSDFDELLNTQKNVLNYELQRVDAIVNLYFSKAKIDYLLTN